jgi:hypothetical protein
MISVNENIQNKLSMPARRIEARVELYYCSALQNDEYNRVLLNTFPSDGALKDFKIERTADDGKFFGFGVCQKLTVKLRDQERTIHISKGLVMEISFGIDSEYTYPCPLFRVEEVSRDEKTNDLTITAFDFLYKAGEHRVSELELTNYTMRAFVHACAGVLNLPVKFDIDEPAFDMDFPTGANFDGSETIREALNAVADATQTIFFVDWDWHLTFKRLDKDAEPVVTVDKSKYFELKNKSDRTLTTICHATELGDNVEATTGEPGVTQYVRNNPFWDLRDDVDVLLNNALAAIAGITISQFDCSWRGNFALEIGDRIAITTKDNSTLLGYVLNDTITYNGGLKEQTFWNFTEHTAETASNPVNLGEALKQTYARVDKANKTITLFTSETNTRFEEVETSISESAQASKDYADSKNTETVKIVEEKVAEINLTTESIENRVSSTETRLDTNDGSISSLTTDVSLLQQTSDTIFAQVSNTETVIAENQVAVDAALSELDDRLREALGEIDAELVTIQSSVDTKITPDDLTIAINQVVEAGSTKVTTSTGFTFDDTGLTVSKSGSEMTTQITEDGMTVFRDGDEVLTADNTGVKAENLHATTYLIIGKNSRFEDYEDNRTGCFWIGG